MSLKHGNTLVQSETNIQVRLLENFNEKLFAYVVVYYVGLNENGSHWLIVGHQQVALFQRIRKCGFARGSVSLKEVAFGGSKKPIPSPESLPVALWIQMWNSKHLLQHVCLHATKLLAMIMME